MRLRLLLLASVVWLNLSCEHADPLGADGPDPDAPTLANVQARVFDQSCALSGCHSGAYAPAGLDLRAGEAHANLVSVRSREVPTLFRVSPGDPGGSYLVMKITGADGIVGGRMPLGRDPLSQAQIDLVTEWIRQGAPGD